MIEILHYLKDPKLWELWYIPYYGYGRICIIHRSQSPTLDLRGSLAALKVQFLSYGVFSPLDLTADIPKPRSPEPKFLETIEPNIFRD